MLRMDVTKKALKFLNSLDAKQFRQVIKKIFALAEDPVPNDSTDLEGYPDMPYRKVDIGEYRIVYHVEDDTLKIALVGKRNGGEVYRQLKNMVK